mmetsp:Transcript_19490/g.42632  ORF Transcript_19490/g.42632 Transcript_19490/m.42632 type:complete len:201 (-) Transcript_19490:1753-2355(-)
MLSCRRRTRRQARLDVLRPAFGKRHGCLGSQTPQPPAADRLRGPQDLLLALDLQARSCAARASTAFLRKGFVSSERKKSSIAAKASTSQRSRLRAAPSGVARSRRCTHSVAPKAFAAGFGFSGAAAASSSAPSRSRARADQLGRSRAPPPDAVVRATESAADEPVWAANRSQSSEARNEERPLRVLGESKRLTAKGRATS